MTLRHAYIGIAAAILFSLLTPAGYMPAAVALIAAVSCGLYAAIRHLSQDIPQRSVGAFALGTFLLALAAYLRFILPVD